MAQVIAIGEALLTDYALVTWVLCAVFALARSQQSSPRVWFARGLALACCIAAVVVHGDSVQTQAGVLAIAVLVLA